MISKEVEKLRGRLFTKEEMEDIIIPILITSKEHLMKNECEPEEHKYLVQLTPELWEVLVYDDTDENLIYENSYFSYNDALYAYDHWDELI